MNCGDPTPGHYCPSCGQRKVDIQVSVRALLMDLLEDQFTLDRRLPRTLGALLLRPGHLTVEFVNGRIVRYIHPFRLYLVTGLIFFVLLSFFSVRMVRTAVDSGTRPEALVEGPLDVALADLEEEMADTSLTAEERARYERLAAPLRERVREARVDSLDQQTERLSEALAAVDEAAAEEGIPRGVRAAVEANRPTLERRLEAAAARRDALLEEDTSAAEAPAPDDGERPLRDIFGWDEDPPDVEMPTATLDSMVTSQFLRLGSMSPRQAAETIAGTFFSHVPTMMFLLLPIFAAALKLLYIRRGRYYAEHFVFLLHVHSVVYLGASLMLVLRRHIPVLVETILALAVFVYIYLAMMRVYGQGWIKTLIKFWILGWTYFWLLSISIPIAIVATLLLF